MKYYRLITLLGIWLIVVPFFAVPNALTVIFTLVPAFFLLGIGIMMSHADHDEDGQDGLSYEEHNPEDADIEDDGQEYDQEDNNLEENDDTLFDHEDDDTDDYVYQDDVIDDEDLEDSFEEDDEDR